MRRFTIAYYFTLVFVFALKCHALKGIALKCVARESVGVETISPNQIARNRNTLKRMRCGIGTQLRQRVQVVPNCCGRTFFSRRSSAQRHSVPTGTSVDVHQRYGEGRCCTSRRCVSAKLHYTDTGYGNVVQHHQRISSEQFYNLYNKFTTNGQKFATFQHLDMSRRDVAT